MMKFIFIPALALIVFSCKDKVAEKPEFSGTITVQSPVENDTIKGGTSFTVTGTITGNTIMHGYSIQVYNQLDQDVVHDQTHHEHSTSFAVNETVTHTLSDTIPLRLVLEAAGDHEGAVVHKEVLFIYIP